jgi:hypothetical protein
MDEGMEESPGSVTGFILMPGGEITIPDWGRWIFATMPRIAAAGSAWVNRLIKLGNLAVIRWKITYNIREEA